MNLVHQQTEFVLDPALATGNLPRFELVVTVRLFYAVVQLAERYNSLDAKG